MERARILLADDQTETVALLRLQLESDHDVVAAVGNGPAAIEAAKSLHPDVFLTNVEVSVLNGIATTREIRKFLPDCRIIFYGSCGDSETMAAAFAAGASGYLINGTADSLLSSIRLVVQHIWSGEQHITQHVTIDLPVMDPAGSNRVAQHGTC